MLMPETGAREFFKLANKDKFLGDFPVIFFCAGSQLTDLNKGLTKAVNGCLSNRFYRRNLIKAIEIGLDAAETKIS
jgi:CheY-like chemotaxis protein